MRDIATAVGLHKVKGIVGEFYDRVQEHPTLARPFQIVDDWEEHKAHLSHFWWVTLGGRPYRNKPYKVADKHAMAGFTPELLVDWLSLFQAILNTHLPADIAQQWFARASNIGRSLKLMHESRRDVSSASHLMNQSHSTKTRMSGCE